MKRILLISDLHCGSEYSVAYPRATCCEQPKRQLKLNKVQRRFYSKWKELCARPEFDMIITMGDLVDGANRKDDGLGIWTSNIGLQASCAAKLLLQIPLKKGGQIYCIAGTGYHTGFNPDMDRAVVSLLNEKDNGKTPKAIWLGVEANIEIEDLKFHVSHWVGGGQYRATALNRELMYSYWYKKNIDGVIRGHVHNFYEINDGFRFGLTLPAWKGRDKYVQSKGLKWGNTMVGWVELEVDGDKWEIRPFLWEINDNIKEVKV